MSVQILNGFLTLTERGEDGTTNQVYVKGSAIQGVRPDCGKGTEVLIQGQFLRVNEEVREILSAVDESYKQARGLR